MVSSLDKVKRARRPAMRARMMISGLPGAGKTWTALAIGSRLAGGPEGVLVIDTEAESALTYADQFPGFGHFVWTPPYDPSKLAELLGEVDEPWRVVVVDSLSHFWRGAGGTLDIADGKFGGWKHARPVQERLLAALLHVRAHLIACVRAKIAYAVEEDGRQIRKLGLDPIQDDGLAYELNLAVEMDLEHRMFVSKSRCPVVPVGTIFGPGEEAALADTYGEWLAGGREAAPVGFVSEVSELINSIPDKERRAAVKREFVARFGLPTSLLAEQMEEVREWLSANA
ncbi:MAG: hypothetical protein KatS3mg014_2513 [Actinomycetota bacterium]|nr:MAG: hypothetical protein KatS3mg014_2492 [Actinomycetota bacterium]GIV00898.1 MAG: hypothetical protein KatS3mg014_2513 [Actinomycetota bacterium]